MNYLAQIPLMFGCLAIAFGVFVLVRGRAPVTRNLSLDGPAARWAGIAAILAGLGLLGLLWLNRNALP